jgi:predicted RNA-binding Zn-ribbon protein involved in translation (DUF1610 family)
MAKCPGQDTRYWRPEDISEVVCGACGYSVEMFKTDGVRRCPQCGVRVINPLVASGCAQWCSYAKECLGFDPKSVSGAQSAQESVAERLIQAMKKEFGDDQKRISHALRVLDHAEHIMHHKKANPKIVIAAAILHDIGILESERKHGSSGAKYQELEGPPIARRILESLDFAEEEIEHICRIVGSHHSANDIDTLEFRIIWDADLIVNMSSKEVNIPPERLDDFIEKTLRTDAGKRLARCQLPGESP